MICSGVCRLLLIADLLAESPTSSDPNIRSGLLSGGHAIGGSTVDLCRHRRDDERRETQEKNATFHYRFLTYVPPENASFRGTPGKSARTRFGLDLSNYILPRIHGSLSGTNSLSTQRPPVEESDRNSTGR